MLLHGIVAVVMGTWHGFWASFREHTAREKIEMLTVAGVYKDDGSRKTIRRAYVGKGKGTTVEPHS